MDSSTIRLTSAVGFSSAFFLSGIGFSAAHLTLPSLYAIPSKPALHVFKAIFYNGAAVVAPLTILSTASFATASYLSPSASPSGSILLGPRFRYGVAAVFAVLSLPYTQVIMMEGIKVLLSCADDDTVRAKVGDSTLVQLLRTWKFQAMVRAGFYFTAGLLGVTLLEF